MKVTITVDPDEVADYIRDNTHTLAYYDGVSGLDAVDGYLSDVIDSVLKSMNFEFDRDDAELGEVIRFPVVIK